MTRIFLSLATLSTLLLGIAFVLGMLVPESQPVAADAMAARQLHLLVALFGMLFAALVHAIVLTYFMGTGRWLEETTRAYRLPERCLSESRSLKYRTVPLMGVCLLLLILTGAAGAAADPASAVRFDGWLGLSAETIHFVLAAAMLGTNLIVNVQEYAAIHRNSQLVDGVVEQVMRIRRERGLPV